jgi:hypothetical protein
VGTSRDAFLLFAAALVAAGAAAGVVSSARPAAGQSAPQPPAVQQPGAQPAAPQGRAGRRPVAGAITSVSDGTFVVTGRAGTPVTVKTTAATRIVSRARGTLANVSAGDFVRVIATKAQDGSLTAMAVQDVPTNLGLPVRGKGRPAETRDGRTVLGGTVTQVGAAALSVRAADGSVASVAVPSTARIFTMTPPPASGLVAGARVVVQGTPNPDGSVTAGLIVVAGPPAH